MRHVGKWFFAKRHDQKAHNAICRHKAYEQTDAYKAMRRAYMSNYYNLNEQRKGSVSECQFSGVAVCTGITSCMTVSTCSGARDKATRVWRGRSEAAFRTDALPKAK